MVSQSWFFYSLFATVCFGVGGAFTLVNAIHAMYLPVTIFTGNLLFQEQFTKRKALLLFLALCSIVLIRLG